MRHLSVAASGREVLWQLLLASSADGIMYASRVSIEPSKYLDQHSILTFFMYDHFSVLHVIRLVGCVSLAPWVCPKTEPAGMPRDMN